MASTNIWQQLKALIPEGARIVATITANNSNGTSQAELRDGSVITVEEESVGVGEKYLFRMGRSKGLRRVWRSMRWRFETVKIQGLATVSCSFFNKEFLARGVTMAVSQVESRLATVIFPIERIAISGWPLCGFHQQLSGQPSGLSYPSL